MDRAEDGWKQGEARGKLGTVLVVFPNKIGNKETGSSFPVFSIFLGDSTPK
jgi:hypothetical protein